MSWPKQDSRQVRAEILSLMRKNVFVVEFELKIEPVSKLFSPDLALFRIRAGCETLQIFDDLTREVRTVDGLFQLEPFVFLATVKPDRLRFAR